MSPMPMTRTIGEAKTAKARSAGVKLTIRSPGRATWPVPPSEGKKRGVSSWSVPSLSHEVRLDVISKGGPDAIH